jgi:excisionase family DNA binding protein
MAGQVLNGSTENLTSRKENLTRNLTKSRNFSLNSKVMTFDHEQFETEFDHAEAALLAFVRRAAKVLKLVALMLLGQEATASERKVASDDKPWLTISETAARLNVSTRVIRDWVKCKDMPHRFVGSELRFVWSEVDAWTLPASSKKNAHTRVRV